MSYIRVSGDQFEINGVRRPYRLRTSFCLLGHYLAGRRSTGQRWLDRLKLIGFDGPRFFGENQDWSADGPRNAFYGTEWTPLVRAFDDYSGPLSQLQLRPGYKEAMSQLADDLIAREMIAEVSCVATVKERDQAFTGHALNKFAQLFRELFPDPKATPFLHETVNEHDAGGSNLRDKTECERYGARWRRSSAEPSHHNYPGSAIGISAGGQWKVGLADVNYSHQNVHPPRGPQWHLGEDRGNGREPIGVTLDRLRGTSGGRPVAFNETVHCMTQAEWDYWVASGRMEKWSGGSTTGVAAHQRYLAEFGPHGVSVCAHDLRGQETDPSGDLSDFERAWKELYNPGSPPPPPPPPAPEPAMKHVATHRNGKTVSYKYIREPIVVEGGSEANVLFEKSSFKFEKNSTVQAISVFHGTDRGDIVEMDTEIYSAPGGIPLYLRSDHKEMPGQYPAWERQEPDSFDLCSGFDVILVCRTNGENYLTDELEARPHWGIWITVREV